MEENFYEEIMEDLSFYGKEPKPDKAVEKLAAEIRKELEETMELYAEDHPEEFDLDEILRFDDALLEELVDRVAYVNILEKVIAGDYKASKIPAEDFERAYLNVIDTMFELSKSISPLAGFGKDRLDAGCELLMNFAGIYWPLETIITSDNIEAFEDYIPGEYYDDVVMGRKHAIGALRHIEGDVCAAGAIVYTIYEASEYEPRSITVNHIQVYEGMRGQGIGNSLMGRLAGLAAQQEETLIFVDVPIRQYENEKERDEEAVLENFLDGWGFSFSPVISADFAVKPSECDTKKLLKFGRLDAVPLRELGDDRAGLLGEFLNDTNNHMEGHVFPFEMYDQDVSSVVIAGGRIRSALLFRRFENGTYRCEGLRPAKNAGEDLLGLIACSLEEWSAFGDENDFVIGTFDSEEAMETVRRFIPSAHVFLKFRGVMPWPDADEVLTEEDWSRLREAIGLSDDKIPAEGLDDASMGKEEIKLIREAVKG